MLDILQCRSNEGAVVAQPLHGLCRHNTLTPHTYTPITPQHTYTPTLTNPSYPAPWL